MTMGTGLSVIDTDEDAPVGANDAGAGTPSSEDRERERRDRLRRALADVGTFGEAVVRMPLRPYQLDVARAVARSVAERQGLTFTVLMPRQSGKNQLPANPQRPSAEVSDHPRRAERLSVLVNRRQQPSAVVGCHHGCQGARTGVLVRWR